MTAKYFRKEGALRCLLEKNIKILYTTKEKVE